MTKIPPDDILEGLYKLRIRESEKLKTVLELCILEIHQKKAGPDNHRLKTMVKRSIEQNLRIKSLKPETEIMRQTPWSRIRGKSRRLLAMESQRAVFWKGDNCSFRHDITKRGKPTQPNPSLRSSTRQSVKNASRTRSPRGRSPSGRMSRLPCKDYLKGICTTPFCEKWHPPECLFYKSENDLGKSALMRIARLMNSLAKSFKRMVTKVQWLCSKLHDNWVAYFKIWSRRSLHLSCGRAQTYWCQSDVFNSLKPWYVMLTFETLGMIFPGDPHQRNPNAPNFEDRSQEETEWQERCAREAAWSLAKNIKKWRRKIKQHSSHFRKIGHQLLNLRKENLL